MATLLGLCILQLIPVQGRQDCTITFYGKVTDERGEPLPGATITLDDTDHGRVSDELGNFRFENLCPKNYLVVVKYIGFQDFKVELSIQADIEKTIALQPESAQLDEVVIRAHQAHTEHVHNSTVMSSKELATTAGKSLGEALKEIPGVNSIQAGPGIFKPVIHGVHSQRILILNYGIRQEGQQWGAEHAPEIDPFIASNIVVIKDATAIKYGTDALGGVIVINPPELPTKSGLGGQLNLVGQSNGRSGTFSGYLEGGIENHNGWGWRVQGTTKKSGDYNAPDYSLTNTGVEELNFSGAIGLHREKFGFEIFASRFQTKLGILKGTSIGNIEDLLVAMNSEQPLYTSDFSYRIQQPHQEVSHDLIKLNAHMKSMGGEWRVQYGYQQNNRKEFDLRRTSLSEIPALNLDLSTHTLEAEWEQEKSEGNTLCVGITSLIQTNTNIPGTQRIPFIPNFANYSAGAFAVIQKLIGKWKWDAGLRFDYRSYVVKGYDYKNSYFNDNLTFANASGSLGANIRINSKNVVHWNVSSAWRPPHVSELYSLGTHQSAAAIEYGLLLNPSTNEVMSIKDVSFKNEQAFKAIATYQHTANRLTFEWSGYENYIRNYIYLKPEGITQNIRGSYPYFRYAQTDVLFLGFDESVSYQLTNNIKLSHAGSIIRALNLKNTGNLPFIPPNRLDVGLRWEKPDQISKHNFYVQAKARYTAKQKHAPRVITPQQLQDASNAGIDLLALDNSNFDFAVAPNDYWLVNLSTGISLSAKGARYDFRIASENLLNTTYREYTNRFRYYADDRGRNIILSIQVNF